MFGVEKPIIALLHLDALPGDPGYCGSMDTVLEHARQDLVALQNGGVDGILFANEFSLALPAGGGCGSDLGDGLYHRRSAPADPGALWRQCGQESDREPSTLPLPPAQDLPGAASQVHTWENMAFIPPTAVRQSATARRWRSRI